MSKRIIFVNEDLKPIRIKNSDAVVQATLPYAMTDELERRGYDVRPEPAPYGPSRMILMKPCRQSADIKNLLDILIRQHGIKEVAQCLSMVAHGELQMRLDNEIATTFTEKTWFEKCEALLE